MKKSLQEKLSNLMYRYSEVGVLLSDAMVINDQNRYRDLSKEYAQLEPVVQCFQRYQQNEKNINSAEKVLQEKDPELKKLAEDELLELQHEKKDLEQQLKSLLLPKDPHDERNVFLEVRAGTGGHEAALFAGDLFRMYTRYAERKGWQLEVISMHEGEQGGYKEVIALISGDRVYSHLKFESGAHRVQRVPTTESQGRVHTSACTVAILPEADAIDTITVNTNDLRIDTFRASGAGGQHVNKTDSAIRITHFPTGIVVECQDERSQHKNKARALSLLQSKILSQQQEQQQQEQAAARRSLVGSGDRSERIRTYNFPQSRVTDHRIQLTLYQLNEVMEGNLELIIEPLTRELQAEELAKLSDDEG